MKMMKLRSGSFSPSKFPIVQMILILTLLSEHEECMFKEFMTSVLSSENIEASISLSVAERFT